MSWRNDQLLTQAIIDICLCRVLRAMRNAYIRQTDRQSCCKGCPKKIHEYYTTNCVLWVKAALIKSLNVRQLMAGHFPTHESAQVKRSSHWAHTHSLTHTHTHTHTLTHTHSHTHSHTHTHTHSHTHKTCLYQHQSNTTVAATYYNALAMLTDKQTNPIKLLNLIKNTNFRAFSFKYPYIQVHCSR